jgi:predicted transcriptional regulator
MSTIKDMTEQIVSKMIAEKVPKTQIAKAMGVSRATIYTYEAKANVQEMVKSIQEKFLQENLPIATQNIHDIVHEKKPMKSADKRLWAEVSQNVMKSVGMLPTPDQSIVVQQMFQQNNVILSPVVQGLLDKHLSSLMNFKADVVDAEEVDKP